MIDFTSAESIRGLHIARQRQGVSMYTFWCCHDRI